MSTLDLALQRALSIRLNLQISLSQLPIIEEWMDIHLDRWLENNPMPHEMPDGTQVTYLASLGSDLKRVWWGAWGDPRGFVPKMADYFKLCNIAKSDAALLDQIGDLLEPRQVGSWIGVWNGKVRTGWHFWDPQPWDRIESMFGTHEAKYQLKKWVEDHGVTQIERFTQGIGDDAFSEIEIAVPNHDAGAQVTAVSEAFQELTGAPLASALEGHLRATSGRLGIAVRIRAGKIVRVGALAHGMALADIPKLCADAKVAEDPMLPKIMGAMGNELARVEYGRAGDRAGVDVYLVPGEPPRRAGDDEEPSSEAN